MAERLDHYTTSTMLVPVVDLVLLVDGRQDEEHEEEQPKRKGSSMQWKRNQLTQGVNLEVAKKAKEGDEAKAKEMPSPL